MPGARSAATHVSSPPRLTLVVGADGWGEGVSEQIFWREEEGGESGEGERAAIGVRCKSSMVKGTEL